MDKSLLDNQTRGKICEILISNYLRELDMLVDYEIEDIDLDTVYAHGILLFDQDEHLYIWQKRVFEAGRQTA